MESMNVIIDDFGTTRVIESKDSDIFEIWKSNENVASDGEWLSASYPLEPPLTIKDE